MKKHSSQYYYDKNPESKAKKNAYDRDYNKTPYGRKSMNQRKRARRMMEKEGKVKPFDGKDVDHKNPIKNGGSNGKHNLRAINKSKNRALANLSKARRNG